MKRTKIMIQLFLEVIVSESDPNWYENISSALKNYCATEEVEVVYKNDDKAAQININYELQNTSLDRIELIVTNTKAVIGDINIHLPSYVSGIADPYSASMVSIPLEEKLKKIKGVLGGRISSTGKIKIEIDPLSKNKQGILEEILRSLPSGMDNL